MAAESLTPEKSPTAFEMLGHIFIGPRGEHVVFSLLTVGGAGVFIGTAVKLALQEFSVGHIKEGLSFAAVAVLGLVPAGIQTSLLGTEGWTPEYEARHRRQEEEADSFYVPPQL